MNRFLTAISFFADPEIDQQRLLQGKWSIPVGHYSEGDLKSDSPLHHLTWILHDELRMKDIEDRPASMALLALSYAALNVFDQDIFAGTKTSFWYGFQYVAGKCLEELGCDAVQVNRESLREVVVGK